MKKNPIKVFASAIGTLVVIIALSIFITSCGSKAATNPNAAFLGTYYGTATYGTNNPGDTVVITAGSTSSSVILLSRGGAPGLSYTINGTVSGTTLTIPSQPVSIFGSTDTVSGTGGLVSSTLTVNYVVKGANTFNLNYTGTKQ